MFPMHDTKNLKPFQIDENYPFSLVTISLYKNKQNIWIFESIFKNEDISLSKYLKF
jgi:hypothetical protein